MLNPRTRYVLPLIVLILLTGGQFHPIHAQTDQRCFPETGMCITGRLRTFWEQQGGLPVFGLPITPQQVELIEGKEVQVQWFERNRLELHPDHAPPYDVLLGRLSADLLAEQGRPATHGGQAPDPANDCRFFTETGYNVCGAFLTAWQARGLSIDADPATSAAESLALFGLPISPVQRELASDGTFYTVQWFERARFELHPNVLLGLLGSEARGYNDLRAPILATPAMLEVEVIRLTNGERTARGLPPLRANPHLTAAARAHNDDMIRHGFFAHQGSDGSSPADRACRQGYTPYDGMTCLVAENIGSGYPTPSSVVAGWMDSPGHRANMLDPNSREIGLGYAAGGSWGHYWTMTLGAQPGVFPIFINDDAPETRSHTVMITLTREGTADWLPFHMIDAVQISEDPSFAGVPEQPWAPTIPFTLSAGSGEKTVFVTLLANDQTVMSHDTIGVREP
jgi:hypothetical protein